MTTRGKLIADNTASYLSLDKHGSHRHSLFKCTIAARNC